MFWGVAVENGKRYSQVVEATYNLTMAALEPTPKYNTGQTVSLMLEQGKIEYLLCTLEYNRVMQVSLNLMFVEGEEVTFFLNGEGVVHLTGFVVDGDNPESESEGSDVEDFTRALGKSKIKTDPKQDSSDSDEDEEDEIESWLPSESKEGVSKRKKTELESPAKKMKGEKGSPMNGFAGKLNDLDHSDYDEDDDSDFEMEGDDDSLELEESGDEDEDSDEDESLPSPKASLKPNDSILKKKTSAQSNLLNQSQESQEGQTPLSKSARKKLKQKQRKTANQTPQTPQEKKEKGTPSPGKSDSKKLVGGVEYQDVIIGNGPMAKSGKMVHVYYSGKLTNNKEFDKLTSGKPFGFRLGQGEVIKGWDVAVQGMKVGGKRKIIIPPNMAYGNKSQGPIPANSTLHFVVELKSVN